MRQRKNMLLDQKEVSTVVSHVSHSQLILSCLRYPCSHLGDTDKVMLAARC
jgi:hypothetical protein